MDRIECNIYNLLLRYFNSPDKVEEWLTTERGGVSPQHLIDICVAEDVFDLVPGAYAPFAAAY